MSLVKDHLEQLKEQLKEQLEQYTDIINTNRNRINELEKMSKDTENAINEVDNILKKQHGASVEKKTTPIKATFKKSR